MADVYRSGACRWERFLHIQIDRVLFCPQCSTQIDDFLYCRFPASLLPEDNANASSRKQSLASSLTTLHPPSRLHVVFEASACPCLLRSTSDAILPAPISGVTDECAVRERALALLADCPAPIYCDPTVILRSCRWAIQRAPPTLHAQLQLHTASSICFCPFIHARSARRNATGTRSSRSAVQLMLATLCLRNLNAPDTSPRRADVACDIHVEALR